MHIRDANPSDAQNLAQLMNIAGSGMPHARWRQLTSAAEDPWDVGYRQVRAKIGEFSYKNCRVVEDESSVVCAMINSFVMSEDLSTDEVPWPSFADPIQELERKCIGSYYINFVATFDVYQGRGFAAKLIDDAERRALSIGSTYVRLIVLESKRDVVRYYEQLGYAVIDRRAAIAMQKQFVSDQWFLMHKDIAVFEKD